MTEAAGGLVEMKERDGFATADRRPGLVEWMPAMRRGRTVTVKLVSYHPDNPQHALLPTILSTLCTFDARTGHLESVMDGTFATAVRTGAASAMASRILARPDSSVLGLIGAGAQAVTQLHALSRLFPLETVYVYDTDPAVARTFASRVPVRKVEVVVSDVATIERRSDIICTATSVAPAAGPVLPGRDLLPHVHVNAVGSDMPGKYELPIDLLRSASVIPDHRAQACAEGECQRLTEGEIGPTLQDLVNDGTLARELRARQTIYDSTGLALHDLAMAELFTELADEFGVGWTTNLESAGSDPHDPYAFLASGELSRPWAHADAVPLGPR